MNIQNKLTYLFLSMLLIINICPTFTQIDIVNASTNAEKKINIGLESGEFTLKTSDVMNFGTHVIENKRKVVTVGFDGDFGVIDARGTQQGWTLTVSATPFSIIEPETGFVEGTEPYSLPTGSLSLNSLETVTAINQEPIQFHPYINTVNAVIDMNETIKIATADIGKGMGEYALEFGTDALSLVIDPVTAKIDTVNYPDKVTPYSSTITWNLISGPEGSNIEDEKKNENENGSEGDNNNEIIGYLFDYRIIDNEEVAIIRYKGDAKDVFVFIPNEIEELPVTTIDDNSFSNKGLRFVSLPKNIKKIGDSAFSDNEIMAIAINDESTNVSIGNYAFSNNLLTSINIPNSVISIGDKAFSYNRLITATVPNTLNYLGEGAFMYNEIESFIFPSNLTKINNHLLYANKLSNIEMPNTVTSIGNSAFAYNRLDSVKLSENLVSIGDDGFAHNRFLSVDFPDSLTTLGQKAFAYSGLAGGFDTNKIEYIKYGAFTGLAAKEITLGKNLKEIHNDAFIGAKFLSYVNNYSSLEAGKYFSEDVLIRNYE